MMILLCKLAIKSEGTRLDNEITAKLLLFSIISFLTKKLNILCSDIFKWTSVLHRGHGSNTNHLKDSNYEKFHLRMRIVISTTILANLHSLDKIYYLAIYGNN